MSWLPNIGWLVWMVWPIGQAVWVCRENDRGKAEGVTE